jgi:hypothetical protein
VLQSNLDLGVCRRQAQGGRAGPGCSRAARTVRGCWQVLTGVGAPAWPGRRGLRLWAEQRGAAAARNAVGSGLWLQGLALWAAGKRRRGCTGPPPWRCWQVLTSYGAPAWPGAGWPGGGGAQCGARNAFGRGLGLQGLTMQRAGKGGAAPRAGTLAPLRGCWQVSTTDLRLLPGRARAAPGGGAALRARARAQCIGFGLQGLRMQQGAEGCTSLLASALK